MGKESERRQACARACASHRARCSPSAKADRRALCAQACAQRAFRSPGEREQLLLAQAEQRALAARSPARDRRPATATRRRAPSGPSPRYARSAPAGRRRRPACSAFFSARMIASNSGPRWRTSTSTSPALAGPRAHPLLDVRRRSRRASLTRGLVSVSVSNGASQPSISAVRRARSTATVRPRRAPRRAAPRCTGLPAVSAVTLPIDFLPREHDRRAPSTFAPERNECSNRMKRHPCSGVSNWPANSRRISSNARGAAPWNEKIDCFSSPTANTVRLTFGRAPPGGIPRRWCAMISHCSGPVSCASSISTWSMPTSSL